VPEETSWKHTTSLVIRNDLTELATVTRLLDEFWRMHGLAAEVQADLNIAIEEIVSNAIRHGDCGDEPIRLRVTVKPDDIQTEIEDSGIAFNPLRHPLPDPAAPLSQRQPGGLGILMVVKLMDEASYEYREGRNCFTMIRSRTRIASESI
jgi:serine/threonine-protein kinase RsbW